MLTHIRGDDGAAACHPVDLLHNVRAGKRPVVIIQGIFPFQLRNMRHPLLMGLLRNPLIQPGKHFLQISYQRNIRLDVLVDLRRIHINVQYLRMLRKFLRISHHTIGETRAESNQQVTLADAKIGSLRAVHTDHARVSLVMAVHNALPHQRIAHRRIRQFCKGSHFLIGLGDDCAAAHIDKRLLGILQKAHRLCERFLCITTRLLRPFRRLFLIFTSICRHIFCDIHKYRAWSAAPRDGKCLSEGICQNCHIFYYIIMFGNGHGDSCDIHFLKRILSQKGKGYIAGNGHHGHRIHISCCDSRHQIGRTRSAGCQTDANPAGGSGIPVCRMCRPLLMRRQNMFDFLTVLIQRIVHIQNRAAGIAEHCIHSLLFQTFHYNLRTCQYHVFSSCLLL